MMANLVAHSSDNKGQFSELAKAICRDFSQHDEGEDKKYQAWQRQKNAKGANKDKPEEPMVAYLFPPADTTKPAFLKNAIALEALGGRTQYFNLPDNDGPGERLFLQLQKVLPSLVHHQLPPDCKDFSDYYLNCRITLPYRAIMAGYLVPENISRKT